jgi:hypothetical protein
MEFTYLSLEMMVAISIAYSIAASICVRLMGWGGSGKYNNKLARSFGW